MVLTLSCRLTAEIRGGRWNIAPVRVSNALAIVFRLSIGEWSLKIHTYSLPAPCWDLTKRVARSMHTTKHPVTLGSRVPECPVLLTRSIRLIQATTSWDDGFDGLSRLMNPDFMYSVISRLSGEHPFGSGVKWLVRTLRRSKFLKSSGHESLLLLGASSEGLMAWSSLLILLDLSFFFLPVSGGKIRWHECDRELIREWLTYRHKETCLLVAHVLSVFFSLSGVKRLLWARICVKFCWNKSGQ